ncbi:Hint domain-containing protein [Phaeobacter inhibens]|uniref:Hint domain-containing protein n=2 Tax=Phaeobacter inhibens TaxID=221822 RepID=UPI002FCD3756
MCNRAITSAHAELMFGSSEVLIAAKHLVNDCSIRAKSGGEVEYYHLLFDRHQVIYAEGVPSESFYPGDQSLDSFSEETREEILELFPELRHNMSAISVARPSLKSYEGQLLQRYVC